MLKKLLSQSSYWVINKELASKLGFEPTLLLTHLIECSEILGQPFYQQRQRIMDSLGWTEYEYKKSVKILKEKNLISAELKGIPPMNFWTINENEIYSLFGSNTPDKWVNITHPNKGENHPTKTRNNKKRNNNNTNQDFEGGTPLEGVSPTSSKPDSVKRKKGGFDKLIELYPESKQRDIINAECIWNELSQSEKQEVMRHVVPYLKNTESKYIKQIGNYMESKLWEKMKSPTKTELGTFGKTGFIDYNLIQYFAELTEQTWEQAQKEFFTFSEEHKKEIIKLYKYDKQNAGN